MANDAHEEFWGCTLTKDKKEYSWDPSADCEEDIEHKLQLTSACLGHKAKDGERNLLELTTEDDDGKKITCAFVSLKAGGKECIHLDLGFFNATKFTLREGSGPIALCGVHLKALPLDFDEDGESSEDEEVPDLVPMEPVKKETKKSESKKETKKPEKVEEKKEEEKKVEAKKETASVKRSINGDKKSETPAKKAKVVKKEESEDDDDDEDDEDEDEEEEESDEEELSENEEPSLLDTEAKEASDEDSEDGDDEPEEGDDVDSDEDEDEDEEMDSEEDEDESDDDDDEEEEEQVKETPKSKVNGHTPKSKPGKGGPQKNKTPAAAEAKTPDTKKGKKDTTTTPKSQAKKDKATTPKSTAKKTPEELKAFLMKSPNLPKKFDKFANFMKNNMKVVDEKSQKELWDFVQKNKK